MWHPHLDREDELACPRPARPRGSPVQTRDGPIQEARTVRLPECGAGRTSDRVTFPSHQLENGFPKGVLPITQVINWVT